MSAPLLEAAKHGRTAEIQRLLRLGASANQCDRETSGSALFWASCGGSYESVRLLLEAGCEVNASNVHGHSPLHAAADRGYTKVVEDLLESGAAVNARNSEGLTPLHLAAYRGYSTTVAVLLRSGADLRILSNDNKTAVHEALAQKHFSVVEAMAHFEETTSSCKLDVVRRSDPAAGSYYRHQPKQSASASGPSGGFHKVKPQPLARDPVQLKKTVSSPPLQSPLREAHVIFSRGKVRADSLDSEGVTVPLQLLPGGQQLPSWCTADLAPLYPRQPASGGKAGWRSDDGDAAAPDRADDTTCQPLSPLHLDSWSDDRLALGNCDDEPSRWSASSVTRLDAPRHSCMGRAAAPEIGRGKAVPAGADSYRSVHHVTVPQDSNALSDLEGSTTGHAASATTAAAHSSSQASATDPSGVSVRAAVAAELCTCAPPAVSLACACSASRLTDCKCPASSEHCWCEADVAGDRAPVHHAQAHSAVRHQQISRSLSMGSKPSCADCFRQKQHLQQQQHDDSAAPPLLRHESDGSIDTAGQASRAGQPPLPRPRCRRALAEASATATDLPPVNRPSAPASACSSLSAVEAEQQAAAEDAAVGSTDIHAKMPSWLPGLHYRLVDGEPFSFVKQRGGSRRLLFRIASMLSVAYTLKVVLNADCDQLPLNLRLLNPAARVALMSSDSALDDQLPPVPAHRHVARILASYFGDGSYFTCIGVPTDAVPSAEQQGSGGGGGAPHGGGARRGLRTHAAIDARLSMRTTQGLAARWQSAGHAVAAMFYVMPGSYVHTLGSFMRCHRAIWPTPPYGIEAGTYLRLAYEMLCAAVHLRQAANLCHCAVTPEAVYLTADARVAVGDMETCAPLLAVDGSCIAYSEESLMQSSCSRNVDYEWWPPELERHILLLGLGRPPEHPIYAHVLHEKSDSYSIGRTMYAIMAAQGRGGKGRNSPPTLFPVISRAKLYYRDDEVPDVTDGCSSDCYPSSLRALLCSLVCDASSRPTAAEALLRIEKELELPV